MVENKICLGKWTFLPPRTILLAHAYFPSNPFDSHQFLEILDADWARNESESGNYCKSEVITAIKNSLKKRRGQGAMAGIVALCYLFLWKNGVTPSLEKASRLASEVGYSAGRGAVLDDREQKLEEKFTMNADFAGIKKNFRKYRSVSHIWAAELSITNVASDRASSDFQESRYALTAVSIQRQLEVATDTTTWKFLDLKPLFEDYNPEIFGWDWSWGRGPIELIESSFKKLTSEGAL